MIHIWKNKWRTLKQQQQHNALICVHIITEKESARVKKCIRTTTTMKKRFQFDWGAREEQENIRKSFFFIRLWVHLEKNMLLIYVMDFFLLFSFSLSHITSNQSFFSFSHCLPACLAYGCVWVFFSSTFAFSIDAILFLFLHTENKEKNRRNFLHVPPWLYVLFFLAFLRSV